MIILCTYHMQITTIYLSSDSISNIILQLFQMCTGICTSELTKVVIKLMMQTQMAIYFFKWFEMLWYCSLIAIPTPSKVAKKMLSFSIACA